VSDAPSLPAPPFERPWLSRYPANVPPTIATANERLPDAVERSVQRWPDRDAFVFYGARWSYRRFWEASGRFAATLHADGFRPGDRLALYLPNCPAYPVAYYGALRLGAVVVQISPLYIAEDLDRLLSDARPKGIVFLDISSENLDGIPRGNLPSLRYAARLKEFYPWYLRPFVNRVARRKGLHPVYPSDPSVRNFGRSLRGSGEFPAPATDPATEVAVHQYTGGTTGLPKAAMLTHRNLLTNALQCQAWFPVQPPGTSVVLAAVPFFHVYGMTVALNYPLIAGSTVILQIRPDIGEMLKLIDRHHPVELPGVPAIYRGLADHPKVGRYDIRSIRVCVSGSAPLPSEVARRFESITGGSLVEGYGLTEASPVTHANPIDHALRRDGSIGLPLPLTDQRVVDLATGTRTLPAGEEGELVVRGPQVMLGYCGRPSETAETIRDGWLYTGDVAKIDLDGYAFIVDRKKDMVDVGGLKVYPREVEEVLYRIPGVVDAACIGVPDPVLGEVLKAFIVAKLGTTLSEAEVIEFVRARIAHYKAPRWVEFRTSLPKSGVQKVLRRELRNETAPAPAQSPR
jgi:long-chain acyl-CoA synthetase